jgi:hypothetical protein
MSLDPSVDLTELLGQILLEQGLKSEAIVVLSSRPEGAPYQLQQKAKHLADAGAFFRAQWMMDKAMAQKGFVPDGTLQGRIAEGTGKVQQAREAYQKGRAAWSDADILPRLFRLALAGGDAGAANRAYQEIRDRGFNADPLARRRLALQLKFPRTSWRARDSRASLPCSAPCSVFRCCRSTRSCHCIPSCSGGVCSAPYPSRPRSRARGGSGTSTWRAR